MEENNNDLLTELLGYEPGEQQVLMILEEVKKTGEDIRIVADRYAMPPIFIPDESGKFIYRGESMTSAQFETRFPHRRFVVISSHENQ